jgi:heme oxygenase (biliverdin-IX-beta and delta-forming)
VHARIDGRFTNGLRDSASRALYLRGMHRTVAAFEAGAAPWRGDAQWRRWLEPARLPLLQEDLDELALASLPPAATPAYACGHELLGALYVLEGSAQGARMMLNQLRQHAAGEAAGTRFLQSHAQDPRRWRELLAQLAQARDDLGFVAVEAGARRTFNLAEASFALAADRSS